MTTHRRRRTPPTIASLLLLAGLCLPIASWGAAGVVTHLGGVLNVTRADGSKKILSIKSEVEEGDVLRTEKDTFARIRFSDGGEIVLRPETVFKIEKYRFHAVPMEAKQDGFMMRLLKGGLRAVTGQIGKRNPNNVRMRAGTATIGIRGTHWGVMCVGEDTCGSAVEDDAWQSEPIEDVSAPEEGATAPGGDNGAAVAEGRETEAVDEQRSKPLQSDNSQSGSVAK